MMMVEQGISASSSSNNCQLPLKEASYQPYPPPHATYEDVFSSRELFMDTLKKLHAAMGTKFMNPVVGGRNLDLYRLFVEVTSRGGIAKVVKEKKWKEVTSIFNFPSSATNASFVLRKYYVSLLYHYEQVYFFKAKCWTPLSADALQHISTVTSPPHSEHVLSSSQQTYSELPQQKANSMSNSEVAVSSVPSTGSPVSGVIDGKFESGYLITVKIGSEDFKGVLYQVPSNGPQIVPTHITTAPIQRSPVQMTNHLPGLKPEVVPHRRKRRKKSEIRKRDPAHPKPNRSGYNFFFKEQHARLKPLYHGRDREISRTIGELWNKLQEPERAVYQEKALRDKERYKQEMEDYRKRLRTGQIINNPVPVHQQHPLGPDINLKDLDINLQYDVPASSYGVETQMSSEKSDRSNLDEYETVDKDMDFGEYSRPDMELRNVNVEVLGDGEAFELQRKLDRLEDVNLGLGHEQGMKSSNGDQNQQILGTVIEDRGLAHGDVDESSVSRNKGF